jgi:hypothetical protein
VDWTCAAGDVCCVHALSGSPMWDVVVQDTHVLARMFAAAMDSWIDGWMDMFSLCSFGWTAKESFSPTGPILSCAYPSLWVRVLTS